jgi:hypothetical protein
MEFFGILRCAQDDSKGEGDDLWETRRRIPFGKAKAMPFGRGKGDALWQMQRRIPFGDDGQNRNDSRGK